MGKSQIPPHQDLAKNIDEIIIQDSVNLLDKPMSYVERQTLGHNIHFLNKEQLLGIVPLMQEHPNQY